MDQNQFISNYIKETTEKFNEALFTRSDEAIISELKKIILSCEREGYFTIKVKKFTVIEDYNEVNNVLKEYEDYLLSKKSSNARGYEDNPYNYIDLKTSALKLLIVTYYISVKDEHDTIDVIIAVPRVVNKFYFLIGGSYYSAMFQIVDASTYNNTTSKSSKNCVTLKTTFQPIRIFRNVKHLNTTEGESIACTLYDNNTFTKSVEVVLYMLARKGYYTTLEFLGISNSIILTDYEPKNAEYYSFQSSKKNPIYINVPKLLMENQVIQHVVYTLHENITKDATMADLFTRDYWISALGANFSQANSYEKGLNILDSLEGIYDLGTRDELHLPWEHRKDVYAVLRWMIYEYNNLKIKDNLNIMTKKIRCAEYIASIYAAKLASNMYRLSGGGKKIELGSIRKVIVTNPLYLVNNMTRCQLINFRNTVTDMDSLLPLKFTYKGISGIGASGGNAIPDVYKLLHVSNMGVLDPDSSSNTDPGITGSIVPLLQIYGNGYFSEFQEPVTWQDEYAKLYNSYKEARGLVEVLEFRKKVLDDEVTAEELINAKDCAEVTKNLTHIALEVDEDEPYMGLPLEGSGLITYESE